MQMLSPSLLSSQGVVHSLRVVACYSNYSSIHSFDYSDYSNCLHTALVVVDSTDSHIGPALRSSALIDTP